MKKEMQIRLVVGTICLLIAVYVGCDLRTLYRQDQLWGQRVLWFWLCVWGSILAFLGQYITTLPQRNKLLGASILSGVLLAGGFMPMPTFFLMFIGFIPLLWAEDIVSKERSTTSKWTIFKLAFNTFLIWNLLTTWWIQNSSFIAGMLGNTLNAVFMTIPFIFYHVTKKNMGQRAANLGFLSFWMTFEIGHLTWDISWPWLTLGNSFAHLPSLVQWYEFTGVFGGSLWILGINIWIADGLFKYWSQEQPSGSLAAVFIKPSIAFIVPILVSLAIYYSYDVTTEKAVEVVSVQPNFEPHYQKFSIPQEQQLTRFMELTETAVTDRTAYVLFPETSFRGIEANKLEESQLIKTLRAFTGAHPKLNLITGLSTYIRYKEGEPRPDNVYTYCNSTQTQCQYRDAHNAAIQLNSQTKEIPYYKKSKLVPGAESMPYIGNIPFFKGLILDLGGAPGLSLGIQDKRAVFTSSQGAVAPLICYESIYGDYVTDYIKEGAEALFVITNDGWWDNSNGHRQHLYLSSLRAIENRRYVVRSANTGVSCFINSRGDIYHPTNYDEAIAIRDDIYLNDKVTFYTLYGDLIGRISILVSIWLLVSMLANGLRGEKHST
ncbi:apolipoprotein N-acyltransferase [Aureispira sp. CCB-E]|uniref:apolipoprotein N-acyltransferase n=1 Tax=Aureispira sp. CCB-E TaxID=3051121 RepID=UPI00286903C6|nr:apolipoprotein N-acyltransferase [Aureispira sp. CCB-E]WMX12729.1 apolipoprotein N-acyltransferase [Aureispira sp. CCB-E]